MRRPPRTYEESARELGIASGKLGPDGRPVVVHVVHYGAPIGVRRPICGSQSMRTTEERSEVTCSHSHLILRRAAQKAAS